ncbi:V-set and immunoglobulin domain-containing protein 10-like [Enoplosus armatus]|uniref:V-set and immunoglobulin domain-containing protein 10-like n=1 Tax=Enoplosus armatus TaxID=215367 RepID=UPI003990F4FA
MTCLDEFGRLSAGFLAILLGFTFQGAHCELVVSAAGPARVKTIAGSNVTLAVSFSGAPDPLVTWFVRDLPVVTWTINSLTPPDIAEIYREVLRMELNGSLSFVNVPPSYTSNYTIEMTKSGLGKALTTFTLEVFERLSGNLMCSVQSVNNVDLRYHCWLSGGSPQTQLSFPSLSSTTSGAGNFSLTIPASDNLNGKTVTCIAHHPVEQKKCNITASSPVEFLPAMRTTVDSEGKIVVTIHCVSEASPKAVVSWSKGSEAVTSSTAYQISSDTTQLNLRDYNVSNLLLQNYTCTCRNPLGSQRREIQLRGPSISDSSLFPNQDGTIVTLTWEVPPTSVVTGFDIQMKGPDLLSKNRNGTQTRGSSNRFHTIQQKPGTDRSADIFVLDPNLTYRFRVIPKARMTEGEPSEVHRIGPVSEGLSGPAIAGIAAGIPCSLLFLFLLGGFIYFCVYCNKNKSRQTRYPVSRAVEKTITTQTDSTPHNLLTGGLKSPPDYNRLQKTASERSVALPSFVPPLPVRVATTV